MSRLVSSHHCVHEAGPMKGDQFLKIRNRLVYRCWFSGPPQVASSKVFIDARKAKAEAVVAEAVVEAKAVANH